MLYDIFVTLIPNSWKEKISKDFQNNKTIKSDFDQAERNGWIKRLVVDHSQWAFKPSHIYITDYDFCRNKELKSSYEKFQNDRNSVAKQEEIIKKKQQYHTSDLGDLDCFKEIYEDNPPIFLNKEKP
jgi:hypothetical protein